METIKISENLILKTNDSGARIVQRDEFEGQQVKIFIESEEQAIALATELLIWAKAQKAQA